MSKRLSLKMDKVPCDIFYIICSFLLPRDLTKTRTLSKQYSKYVETYLKRTFKTTVLFDLICPLCGNDWISKQNIMPNDFLDIDEDLHFFEVIQRHKFINENFNKKKRRDHLLCEECEDTLQENIFLTHFRFPYNYQVYIDFFNEYPWACLVKSTNNEIIWNQYNCIADENMKVPVDTDSDYEDENNYYLEWDRGEFA